MQVLLIFHVLVAIAMVALVLVQRGAGATAGAAFGSGASGTVFGARGAGTFLTKSTWALAFLFCALSLAMAVVASRTAAEPGADLGVVSTVVESDSTATDSATGIPAAPGSVADEETLDLPSPAAEDASVPAPVDEQVSEDLPVAEGAGEQSAAGEGGGAETESDGS